MTAPRAAVYRWADVETDIPMPTIQRKRIIGEKAMISHILLAKGTHVPTHSHEPEQIGVVLRGRIRFGVGADGSKDRYEVTIGEGEVIHLPSNVPHSADAIEETLILDIFSPPAAATGVDRK